MKKEYDTMSYNSNFENKINDLPYFLNVGDVANLMGVCKSHAYSLFNNPDFPAIKMGRRMVVSTSAFFKWAERGIEK